MSTRIELWAVGLLVIAGLLAILVVSAMARVSASGDTRFGRAGQFSVAVSRIPEEVAHALRILVRGDRPDLEVVEDRFAGRRGFSFQVAPGSQPDAGYLVLSRYDGDLARSVIELVDLDAQRIVHRWAPDFAAINARSRLTSAFTRIDRDNSPTRARAMHAMPTADGGLVFQNHSPLVKIGACGEIRWTIDRLFHHAVEPHGDGGWIISTFIEPSPLTGVGPLFRDDGIAHVSDDGRILWEQSVARILLDNGYGHLVHGQGAYTDDPLHLNDVQFVPFDGPHFRRGDLLLSLRNVSAIVLYRPSANRVIWVKQGPWVNQHDVDVVDASRISVFSNNRYNYVDRSVVHGANEVMIYDLAAGVATSPFANPMKALEIRTGGEGLADLLSNGDVIVEETEAGRILQFAPDGRVKWDFINRAADGQLYLLSWSRHLGKAEGARLLEAIAAAGCRAAS